MMKEAKEYSAKFYRDGDYADDEKRLEEIALELAEISKRHERGITVRANTFYSCGEWCTSAEVAVYNHGPVMREQKDVYGVYRTVLRNWKPEDSETCEGMIAEAAAHDVKGE